RRALLRPPPEPGPCRLRQESAEQGPGTLGAVGPGQEPDLGFETVVVRLRGHQRWFVNARPGLEIEQKFTLAGRPDIWLLAARTRDLVAAGAINGWIPEHGSNGGFEQWDFLSHIYEIAGPEAERGYIAFIPAVDGSWGIRRKWFTADAVIRREQLTGGLDLGPAA
nr:hypothetical protein [Actinomycetota bacterium]